MQVHNFELDNIRVIDEAILNRKTHMFSGENNFDEETAKELGALMDNMRKTFYEKKFTKQRVAELQRNGYIENSVYSEYEMHRILGPQSEVIEDEPSWVSSGKRITNNEPQLEPLIIEEDFEVPTHDEVVTAELEDDAPWWSDE